MKAGRTDLIGWDEQCLIRPKRPKKREVEDGGAPRKGKGRFAKGGPAKGAPAKGAPSSRPGPASAQRAGKPPKANGRKGGIRKGR